MEKNIKDYLHLYLWCEMQYCDGEIFTFIGLPNIFGELHAEVRLSSNKTSAYPLFTIKPILRSLADMTDEELNYMNDGHGVETGITVYYTPEGFKYLLSKHFDLFGLIESGLAIDKTKAAQQQNK